MRRFGLIGKQLSHSFSASYFNEKFDSLAIAATYHNVECDTIQDVERLLKGSECLGFNVTVPYKESIIPFLDEVDPIAGIDRCSQYH